MSESALDRVARALDLVPFISRNPGLSIVQIAERFGSTPTQISKDLSLLHMCGLPGYSHLELLDIDYVDPDYVSVTDAQVLERPRSLTQVEAVTLVLGLQLLAELASDNQERLAITSLQERITARYGTGLAESISITDAVAESPLTSEISLAISAKRKLRLKYSSASSDSITSREALPIQIYYINGFAYLRAISLEANAERSFRLDRITELSIGEKVSELAASMGRMRQPDEITEIEILMATDGFFFVERHNEIVTSVSENNGRFRITLSVTVGEWITRTLLAWPSKIEVLKPESLAQAIQQRIADTLANYQ